MSLPLTEFPATQQMTEPDRRPSPDWYRSYQELLAYVRDLEARITALEP